MLLHFFESDACGLVPNDTVHKGTSRVLFQINAETLPPLEDFTYLARTIAYNKSNWAAVYQNLWKSRKHWGVVARVLERTGATVWALGAMYKAVAQLVLLYGSKRWVVTGEMLKVLKGFQHQADRWITGLTAKHRAGREWE